MRYVANQLHKIQQFFSLIALSIMCEFSSKLMVKASQLTFNCFKSTIETVEKGEKYV